MEFGFMRPILPMQTQRNICRLCCGRRGSRTPIFLRRSHILQFLIQPILQDSYGLFEEEARQRLRGRDEEDWPVLAAALALSCAIWTEDTDFFGSGIAVWTSDRIEIFLKEQLKSLEANETWSPSLPPASSGSKGRGWGQRRRVPERAE
jgi:hypothetical protein